MSTQQQYTSSDNSPRGPTLELDNVSDTWTSESAASSLAENGYRAIQEIERVLFFTDLKDDTERQQAAEKGLIATQDLKRLLFVSSIDNSMNTNTSTSQDDSCPAGSDEKKTDEPNPNTESPATTEANKPQNNALSSSASAPAPSTALMACSATMSIMDLLKSHFESAWSEMEKVGHKAVKEAERKILFTDLDEKKLAVETSSNKGTSTEVLKEIEVLLQDLEHKWASYAVQTGQPALESGARMWKEMEQSSQKAYNECERVLMFTDLDEAKLAKDKSNINDDLINHFVNFQGVFQELEQKFFKTNTSTRAEI